MSKGIDLQKLYRERGDNLFAELYTNHRNEFVHWAHRSFACEEEDSVEAFQEAIVLLHRKIDSNELNIINASLKTYLFAVGKNLLRRKFDEQKRTKYTDEFPDELISSDWGNLKALSPRQESVKYCLAKLQKGCQELLTLFYYKNFAIDAIMHEMGFNSEEVVRTKKYKCLKQLRALVAQENKVKNDR